jgi:hypothetical protein
MQAGTKVYAVFTTIEYEGSNLVDIYNTREAADAKRDEILVQAKPGGAQWWIDNANVEDWTVLCRPRRVY